MDGDSAGAWKRGAVRGGRQGFRVPRNDEALLKCFLECLYSISIQ
jgi:hypothetical protein